MENMNKQICEKLKNLLPLYLTDELGESEKKEVEEHIHECEECKQLFYNKEDEIFMQDNKELTKSFKRLNSKFIRTVAYTVIGCLLVINLFMALFPIATKEAFKKQEAYAKKAHLYDLLLKEPLVDYITIDSSVGLMDTAIKCKYSISTQGNPSIQFNEDIKIPHFSGYAKFGKDVEQYTTFLQYASSDYLMSSIHRKAVAKVNEGLTKTSNKCWERLGEFPKGTLSQVAISFNKPVSVDDMINLINGVGDVPLNKCWFCIDTSKSERRSGPVLWGFSTLIFQAHDDEVIVGYGGEKTTLLSNCKDTYKPAALKNMASSFQSAMKEYEKYVNGLNNYYSLNGCGFAKEGLLSDIRFINKQIEDEGIKIQSAILAAPTENILKLKENTNIQYINIVGVGFDSYISRE